MHTRPFLSIITVNYNSCSALEKTIKSVVSQKVDGVEYIVIDGGSIDRSVDILRDYDEHIDYWVSEKDKGIYDAMNKAVDIAKGEGIIFINSGDFFVGEVISPIMPIPCFIKVAVSSHNKVKTLKLRSEKLGLPYCHQGIVFENKKIKYNMNYKVASDYDFFLKHGYDKNIPFFKCSGLIVYDNSGFSKVNYKKRDVEISDIIAENFGLKNAFIFKAKCTIKNIVRSFFK